MTINRAQNVSRDHTNIKSLKIILLSQKQFSQSARQSFLFPVDGKQMAFVLSKNPL